MGVALNDVYPSLLCVAAVSDSGKMTSDHVEEEEEVDGGGGGDGGRPVQSPIFSMTPQEFANALTSEDAVSCSYFTPKYSLLLID